MQALALAARDPRLVVALAQELRTSMDSRLHERGLTTRQSALLVAIELEGSPPSMTGAAQMLGVSHQNAKELPVVLQQDHAAVGEWLCGTR